MKFPKEMKKLLKKLEANTFLVVIAVGLLIWALANYSQLKSKFFDPMTGNGNENKSSEQATGNRNVSASLPLGQNSGHASANGVNTDTYGLPPSCARQEVVDPSELLPKDANSEFSKLNPMGSGDLENVSLLRAGHHIGINTVGQSLRNANLQLRSEPANPQMNVGPWNNTTISPDNNRLQLEIGSQ